MKGNMTTLNEEEIEELMKQEPIVSIDENWYEGPQPEELLPEDFPVEILDPEVD